MRLRALTCLVVVGAGLGLATPAEADPGCGVPLVAPAGAPVGITECSGIRPGAWVGSQTGRCTLNFIFDGSDGRTYAGTAGHCILESNGEKSWTLDEGPEARFNLERLKGAVNVEWKRGGEFAYAVLNGQRDFAVVRVDAAALSHVYAGMCHFGGPTGYNDDVKPNVASGPTVFHHFGNGVGVGWALPGRSMVATFMPDSPRIHAFGSGVFGDSGSGVISADGRAVGVLVTIGAGLSGTSGITRLSPQVALAEAALGVSLSLRTAPLT